MITANDIQIVIREVETEMLLRVAAVLKRFYLSPISASSLQPILELAVELNPELGGASTRDVVDTPNQ